MKTFYKVLAPVLLVLLVILAFKTPSQDNTLFQRILQGLRSYQNDEGPEKTYVQTDKDLYTNGETIWFKAYLVDGITHRASDRSKVVYVDLLDGSDSLVASRKLFVEDLGAPGDIQLGKDIAPGEYTLRAYTRYMLNDDEPVLFEKKLPVFLLRPQDGTAPEDLAITTSNNGPTGHPESADAILSPRLRFFPEGGHMVADLPATIGLEATDPQGNPIALKGTIKDRNGTKVTDFESLKFGLGSVGFTPLPNTQYYASVPVDGHEEKYPLPTVDAKGYVLSIKNRGDELLVQVATNSVEGLDGTLLVGHLRGNLIYKRIGTPDDRNAYATRLYTNELADGVAQFTLFAPNGEPLCERLVFVDFPENDVQLTLAPNAKRYGLRDKVSLDLALTNSDGIPLQGDFSMGVIAKSGARQSTGVDIKSWLLLDSDLGGTVRDSGYFFEDNSKERKIALDALMLTHGWRRFVWKDLLDPTVRKVPHYPPEKGIVIDGHTSEFKKPDLPKKSKVTLNMLGPEFAQGEMETDEQGAFEFGPLFFNDTLNVVLQAVDPDAKRKAREKDLSIWLDPVDKKIDAKNPVRNGPKGPTLPLAREYLEQAYEQKAVDFEYDPKVTQLDEVVVTKKRTRDQVITEMMNAERTTGLFSQRVYTDSIPGGDIFGPFELLQRVPGVRIFGDTLRMVTIRNEEPLLLLNGVETDFGTLNSIRGSQVMFIDVMKGPDTNRFGMKAFGGVVAVYLKRGFRFDDEAPKAHPGVATFKIPGFYKVREFYTPDYSVPKDESKKPDYRTTLFWEPDLKIGNDGKASVYFYTGDRPGTYLVNVEGISTDGRPIHSLATITVEAAN